jgi:hypothetical protein
MKLQLRAHFVLAVIFPFSVQLIAQSNTANPPPDWVNGDVFVGVSNGSYQVWHNTNLTSGTPTYQLVNTISDGLAGATNGCGFDLAYRFFGTNSTHNFVDRYAIDNGHPIPEQLSPGSSATSAQSIAFDGASNLYIGFSSAQSGSGIIERWTKDTNLGKFVQTGTFSVPVDGSQGPGWIDLAADGHTLFYTSQGPTIRTFDTSGSGTSGIYTTLTKGTTLFALRILAPGDGSGGVLVAAQSNVLRVNSGGVVTKLAFGKEKNLQALSLDSSGSNRAWVGDTSSNDFILFDYVAKATIASLNTGTGPLGGVCVDGSFSAAEIAQQGTQQIKIKVLSANSSTITFPNLTGGTFTETFVGIPTNKTITVTVRDSIVDQSLALSDPTVFSFNPGNPVPGSALPAGNLSCDTSVIPGKCELYEVEASPNSGYTSANTLIEAANSPGLFNARLLRNLDEDITDDADVGGTRTTKCVYTINQQVSNPTFQICGSLIPTDGTVFTKSAGSSTITFKLQVEPTGQCGSSSRTPNFLKPLLMITQLQPTVNGITPAPVSIPVLIAGNSGGPPVMTLSGNTYQLQVKTTDIPAGFTYVASVVDLTATIPSTAIHFTMTQ